MKKKYKWGLDLGTNSIGFSVIDFTSNKIEKCGARIIPELDKENKCPYRRIKRQMRRQKDRKKMRKETLIRTLQPLSMFPQVSSENRKAVLLAETLKTFYAQNPYQLRTKALEVPLTLYELGRLFFQLAQRRGFPTQTLLVKKEDKATMQNEKDAQKLGMHAMPYSEAQMQNYPTFGAMLYHEDKKNPAHHERVSIRRRYTKREWFEKEFELIWQRQQKHHKTLLTPTLKEKIRHILFYQRPLKPQKQHIGYCTFEENEKRASKDNLFFEEYRFYKTLNTLKIDGNPLTLSQRSLIEKKQKYLLTHKKISDIRKLLKIDDPTRLNFQDDQELPVCKLAQRMITIFGKKNWDQYSLSSHNNYLARIRKCKTTTELEDLADLWGIKGKKLDKLYKLQSELTSQYASLSEKVLRATLPFLKGDPVKNRPPYPEHIALPLASLQKVFDLADTPWKEQNQERIIQQAVAYIQEDSTVTQTEKLQKWLKESYQISDEALESLYHHSHKKAEKLVDQLLREHLPHNLRNPTVMRVLGEMRLLVNGLLKRYGAPEMVYIEFARELKKSEKERETIAKKQRAFKAERDAIKLKLAEWSKELQIPIKPSASNILKVQLYEETKGECVYTAHLENNRISLQALFTDAWDIDHIVPKSLSHTNARFNLTLCPANLNRHGKGQKTPYQFFKNQPQQWEKIKACAKNHFSVSKYHHFISQNVPEPQFLDRNAHDTSYIAREARKILEKICHDVRPVKGGVTALLRHQ